MKGVTFERSREINELEQNLFKTIGELLPKQVSDEPISSIQEINLEQALKELLELENNNTIIQ